MIFKKPLLLLLICLFGVSSCTRMEKRSSILVKKPLAPVENKIQPRLVWSKSMGSGVGVNKPELLLAKAPDRLIVADAKGQVVAFDPNTGRSIWREKLKTAISAGPSVSDTSVIVGTRDAQVLALDLNTGKSIWKSPVAGEVLAEPAIGQDFVFVHTLNGGISALNLENGRQFWRYSLGTPALMLRRAAKPLLTQNSVVGGFSNGHLVALNRLDGAVAWENVVSMPKGRVDIQRMVDIGADPIYYQGQIYGVSYQGKLSAYSEHTGELLWDKALSSYTGMVISDGHLWITDLEGSVWCLDPDNGQTLWKQADLYGRKLSKPTVYRDWVIVGDDDGYLHFLSKTTGEFLARVQPSKKSIEAPIIVFDETLYALDYNGKVFAYRITA